MNSNYGTSFDNYPFQTPIRQTSNPQYISDSTSSSTSQYQMPPQNPFIFNTSTQNNNPWPMPILNDFSKFGS